eukprot:m.44628 g.44628  ORF g.44628 m.44628 type:complete len:1417 (-) comp11719_c0_seq3:221-4471(-)
MRWTTSVVLLAVATLVLCAMAAGADTKSRKTATTTEAPKKKGRLRPRAKTPKPTKAPKEKKPKGWRRAEKKAKKEAAKKATTKKAKKSKSRPTKTTAAPKTKKPTKKPVVTKKADTSTSPVPLYFRTVLGGVFLGEARGALDRAKALKELSATETAMLEVSLRETEEEEQEVRDQAEDLLATIKGLQAKRDGQADASTDLSKRITVALNDVQTAATASATASIEVTRLETELASARQNSELNARFKQLDFELNVIGKQYNAAVNGAQEAEVEAAAAKRSVTTLETNMARLQLAVEQATNEAANLKKALTETEVQIIEQQNNVLTAKQQVEHVASQRVSFQASLLTERKSIAELEQRIEFINFDLARYRTLKSLAEDALDKYTALEARVTQEDNAVLAEYFDLKSKVESHGGSADAYTAAANKKTGTVTKYSTTSKTNFAYSTKTVPFLTDSQDVHVTLEKLKQVSFDYNKKQSEVAGKVADARRALEGAVTEITRLEREKLSPEATLKANKISLETIELQAQAMDKAYSLRVNDLEAARKQLATLQSQYTSVRTQLDGARSVVAEKQKDLEVAQTSMLLAQAKYEVVLGRIARLRSLAKRLLVKITAIKDEITDIQVKLLATDASAIEEELTAAREVDEAAKEALQVALKALTKLESERAKVKGQQTSKSATLEVRQDEYRRLLEVADDLSFRADQARLAIAAFEAVKHAYMTQATFAQEAVTVGEAQRAEVLALEESKVRESVVTYSILVSSTKAVLAETRASGYGELKAIAADGTLHYSQLLKDAEDKAKEATAASKSFESQLVTLQNELDVTQRAGFTARGQAEAAAAQAEKEKLKADAALRSAAILFSKAQQENSGSNKQAQQLEEEKERLIKLEETLVVIREQLSTNTAALAAAETAVADLTAQETAAVKALLEIKEHKIKATADLEFISNQISLEQLRRDGAEQSLSSVKRQLDLLERNEAEYKEALNKANKRASDALAVLKDIEESQESALNDPKKSKTVYSALPTEEAAQELYDLFLEQALEAEQNLKETRQEIKAKKATKERLVQEVDEFKQSLLASQAAFEKASRTAAAATARYNEARLELDRITNKLAESKDEARRLSIVLVDLREEEKSTVSEISQVKEIIEVLREGATKGSIEGSNAEIEAQVAAVAAKAALDSYAMFAARAFEFSLEQTMLEHKLQLLNSCIEFVQVMLLLSRNMQQFWTNQVSTLVVSLQRAEQYLGQLTAKVANFFNEYSVSKQALSDNHLLLQSIFADQLVAYETAEELTEDFQEALAQVATAGAEAAAEQKDAIDLISEKVTKLEAQVKGMPVYQVIELKQHVVYVNDAAATGKSTGSDSTASGSSDNGSAAVVGGVLGTICIALVAVVAVMAYKMRKGSSGSENSATSTGQPKTVSRMEWMNAEGPL